MVKVIVPAFYALHDTRTPVRIAVVAMVLNIVFNIAFFRPLQVGAPALATSLAGVFNAVALMVVFNRREGSIDVKSILDSLTRFVVASVPMGMVAVLLINWPGLYFGQALGQRIFALALTIASAGFVYFLASYMLRCRELGEFRQVFLKRR